MKLYNYFENDLEDLRKKYCLFAFRDCTKQETDEIKRFQSEHNNIPDDVMVEDCNGETVYRRQTEELDSTHEERIEYIMLMQTEHLSAIRKMLLFFVVLACIGLATGLIAVLVMQSA